jgi:hypothetical protein
LPEGFALFFTINVLANSFTHDPVRRTMARFGQVFYTGPGLRVEFNGDGFSGDVGLWHDAIP